MSEASPGVPDLLGLFVGFPKGGTTLASQIIARHPEVVCGFGGGFLLADDPAGFAQQEPFFGRLTKHWDLSEEDVQKIVRTPTWSDMYREVRQRAADPEGPPGQRVLDKTPRYMAYLPAVMAKVPGVPVIAVTRDPRAVIASWARRDKRPHAALVKKLPAYIRKYQQFASGLNRASQLQPGRILVIAFEDLCTRPEQTARRMFDWFGLAFDPEYLHVASDVPPVIAGGLRPSMAYAHEAVPYDVGREIVAAVEHVAHYAIRGVRGGPIGGQMEGGGLAIEKAGKPSRILGGGGPRAAEAARPSHAGTHADRPEAADGLRILIVSQPKTGNTWVKHLLHDVYRLPVVATPDSDSENALHAWLDEAGFPRRAIAHQHYRPTNTFFDAIRGRGIQLITTLRDPYDTFTSLYHYIQRFPEIQKGPLAALVGRAIDDAEVLDFLHHGFQDMLRRSANWRSSGASIVVRYEDLLARPVHALKELTDQIEPVDPSIVQTAVQRQSADRMRSRNHQMQRFVRSATTGDWRNHLTEAHLGIFRGVHADIVKELGYPVR